LVEMSVPSRRGIMVKPDLRVHNATDLHTWEIGEDDGLPLTTPARTLLDLAAVVPRRARPRGPRQDGSQLDVDCQRLAAIDLGEVERRRPAHEAGVVECHS
jgi:hypothetical protein